MSSLLEMLASQLTSNESVSKLSNQLGADRSTTQTAMSAALPVLMAALARNASRSDGAQALNQALDKHDGGVLDNLGTFLESPDVDDGNGILRHLLGDRRGTVEQGVSKASGLDTSMVAQLLPMLAPIVMGALGRQRRQQNLDASGLSNVLGMERQQMEQQNPAMGMLGRMLDQDDDGSVVDDLGRMGKSLLGGLFSRH